ncbi:hypothetical protein C0989_002489 [Termitomyces sp. Mn162]|nr:hypothetical protein C0989_002489 [Termitomyces sp. Mn162]
MDFSRKDSMILPKQKGSAGILGIGPTRRAVLPQSPNHDRAISTLDNAIQTINLVHDAIPFQVVKGVLASIAGILGIVKNTFSNQCDFHELAEQCQMVGLVIWRATSQTSEHQLDGDVRRALADLERSVNGILDAVKVKAEKSLGSKVLNVTVNQETIIKWRSDLSRFMTLFNILGRQPPSIHKCMHIQTPSVPSSPRVFVGRDDLVWNTTSSLLECHHVALIGPGGIGKSSIARAVINNKLLASTFQDRRFFVRFDDIDAAQVNIGTFLDRIARALGLVATANAHDRIARALSISQTLLVLDNAETFLDAAVDSARIAAVIDEFGAQPNVAILLTTRTTVLPPNLDWVRLRVPVFEESAACEAFKAFYPAIETSVLLKLLSAVDFHPLSINLLAQVAVQNEWSPQDLATAWHQQRAALLETGEGKIRSIAVTIETSLNSPSFVKLGKMAHDLLQIIAFLPQGISKMQLNVIFSGQQNPESCADALCRQSLAYSNGDFITLLAPIRLYLSKRYKDNVSLLKEVRSYYAARVEESIIVGQQNANIEYVLTHWLKDPALETIPDVLEYIGMFISTLSECCPRAVSMRTAISTLDTKKSYGSMASCMNFNMVVSVFRRCKLPLYKSTCLLMISHLMRLIGQMDEAEEAYTEARMLALEAGNPNLLALVDCSLVAAYYVQGNFQAAEELLHKALRRFHRSSWSTVLRLKRLAFDADLKLLMIQLNMVKGKPNAFQGYLEALPILRKECDSSSIAELHFTAGLHELYNNHPDSAKACFEEMQANVDKDGPAWVMASVGLAEVSDQQGDHGESRAWRARLLELVQVMPGQSTEDVDELTALLAGYLALEGDVKRARKMIILPVTNATQDLSVGVVNCKYLAGMIELTGGDFDKAEEYFHDTIESCTSLAEFLYRARSHRAIGEIFVVKGDLVPARKHFEITDNLCKTMGIPRERLYFGLTCYIPSKTLDGWRIYQEGHAMFNEA